MCEVYSNVTIKTPKPHQRRRSDVLWVTFTHCSRVSIVDFEQVNAGLISSNMLYHNYLSQLLKGLEFKLYISI